MGAGAGTPGGMVYKLKYGRPIPYLDDIAADFPELNIVGAHPAWPWQEESLAIARQKPNYYIDLSGWAPRYFPSQLVQYAGSILQDLVLFGSDWPAMQVERWLEGFEGLPIKAEVRPKMMLENRRRLLRLPDCQARATPRQRSIVSPPSSRPPLGLYCRTLHSVHRPNRAIA